MELPFADVFSWGGGGEFLLSFHMDSPLRRLNNTVVGSCEIPRNLQKKVSASKPPVKISPLFLFDSVRHFYGNRNLSHFNYIIFITFQKEKQNEEAGPKKKTIRYIILRNVVNISQKYLLFDNKTKKSLGEKK